MITGRTVGPLIPNQKRSFAVENRRVPQSKGTPPLLEESCVLRTIVELAPAKADGVVDRGDIMISVPRITKFLREVTDDPDLPVAKVYYWIAKGFIRSGRLGSVITASKKQICEDMLRPTNLAAGE
jgi:hypothetical protein